MPFIFYTHPTAPACAKRMAVLIKVSDECSIDLELIYVKTS